MGGCASASVVAGETALVSSEEFTAITLVLVGDAACVDADARDAAVAAVVVVNVTEVVSELDALDTTD